MNATLVSPPPKEAKPGEFVTHVFKVDNSSDSPETYDLEAASSNNWNIIGLMPSIKISPGKRIFVPLTVQVPPGTLASTEDVLSLTLRPRDDTETILTGSATTRVILVPGGGHCFRLWKSLADAEKPWNMQLLLKIGATVRIPSELLCIRPSAGGLKSPRSR